MHEQTSINRANLRTKTASSASYESRKLEKDLKNITRLLFTVYGLWTSKIVL